MEVLIFGIIIIVIAFFVWLAAFHTFPILTIIISILSIIGIIKHFKNKKKEEIEKKEYHENMEKSLKERENETVYQNYNFSKSINNKNVQYEIDKYINNNKDKEFLRNILLKNDDNISILVSDKLDYLISIDDICNKLKEEININLNKMFEYLFYFGYKNDFGSFTIDIPKKLREDNRYYRYKGSSYGLIHELKNYNNISYPVPDKLKKIYDDESKNIIENVICNNKYFNMIIGIKDEIHGLLKENTLKYNLEENRLLSEIKSTKSGNKGEQEVFRELYKYKDDFVFLEGIRLPVLNKNLEQKSSECDGIIISKKGIFCLEIKNYGSESNFNLIIEEDGRWIKDYGLQNIIIPSAEFQNLTHIDTIKMNLKEELNKDYNINGIIVIANDNVSIKNHRKCTIIRKEFIKQEIENFDDNLSDEEILEIKNTLIKRNLGEMNILVNNYRKTNMDILIYLKQEIIKYYKEKEQDINNCLFFYRDRLMKKIINGDNDFYFFYVRDIDNKWTKILNCGKIELCKNEENKKAAAEEICNYSLEKDFIDFFSFYETNKNEINSNLNYNKDDDDDDYNVEEDNDNYYEEDEPYCTQDDLCGDGWTSDGYYYYGWADQD